MWLVGGDSTTYGNVFVLNSDGVTGPVCDDHWNDKQAVVVCRQLGFKTGTAILRSKFGDVPLPFAMDAVACTGSETRLQDCQHSPTDDGVYDYYDYYVDYYNYEYDYTDHCEAGEGAGVRCSY